MTLHAPPLSDTHHRMMALGARCDVCPLARVSHAGPVESEILPGTTILTVGQEPGNDEVRANRPLCGPSGRVFDRALLHAGRPRTAISTSNVVACQPPKGDIAAYEAKLQRDNKKRLLRNEASVPSPTECCSPRLHREASSFRYLMPLGTVALHALVPKVRGGIEKNRGRLFELPEWLPSTSTDPRLVAGRRTIPTYNPAAVGRTPPLWDVFVRDVDRLFRWSEGRLTWTPPSLLYRPDPAQLQEILTKHFFRWNGWNVHDYDTETDSIHARVAHLRCIQIGTPEWAVVVPFRSVRDRREEGPLEDPGRLKWAPTSFLMDDGSEVPGYDEQEWTDVVDTIVRWCEDRNVLKTGWNAGSYDYLVLSNRLGVSPTPLLDKILVKRSVLPALPHDLGFSGSFYLDIHNWKGDHSATEARSDEELWRYGGIDASADARLLEPLWVELVDRDQTRLCALDHEIQKVGVGMHTNGMFIDQAAREARDRVLRTDTVKWTMRTRQLLTQAGVDVSEIVKRSKKADARNAELKVALSEEWDGAGLSAAEIEEGWDLPEPGDVGLDVMAFNPFSHPQLRAVLFDAWDLPVPTHIKEKDLYTKSGEVSTGDAVLRSLVVDPSIDELQRQFIHSIRMARRWGKEWGTYVRPTRPRTGDAALDKGCILWPDGRVHPSWNSHTAITGRFASSGPNNQNAPPTIKPIYVPEPGRVYVGADYDQLELRIAASRWKAQGFLKAFAEGLDPHQITMLACFGEELFWSFKGGPSVFGAKDFDGKGQFAQMRKLAKALGFAAQYGASLETIARLITSAEDKKTGKLLYAQLSMSEDIAPMYERWLSGVPEFPRGWKSEESLVRKQGFLREPVTGRRRDFPAGFKRNRSEVVNFPVQGGAAGIVNEATVDLVREIPFGAWGPGTGLVNQCHDALVIECAEKDAEEVRRVMNRVLERCVEALPGVRFTAEASIGRNWAEA